LQTAPVLFDKEGIMLYAFIRGFIGGMGRAILDFYVANSLYINAIILAYALCVVLANQSYALGLHQIKIELEKSGKKLKNRSLLELKSALEDNSFPWRKVQASYWFPLITTPRRILMFPKNINKLKKIFNAEILMQGGRKQK
jgi:hypothetical protein